MAEETNTAPAAAAAAPEAAGDKKAKKNKNKKNILNGIVHIQSTFNNTLITFTDVSGNVISWSSAGARGFKGSRKSTPFAAQGAPGDGKTAFLLQVASRCQSAALVVSCEMPILELFRRLIARESNTFLGNLKDGTIGAPAIERLAIETARRLPSLALVDATLGCATAQMIADQAAALRDQAGTGHVLVAIDSLQVWARGAGEGVNEYEAVSAGVVSARSIADTLKAPVLVTSLRNRAGQKEG